MSHREDDGDMRKNEVLADLFRLQTRLSPRMLLGYIKTKVSLSFTFDMLDDMNREALALEQEIGFRTWNWVLDREVPGRVSLDPKTKLLRDLWFFKVNLQISVFSPEDFSTTNQVHL